MKKKSGLSTEPLQTNTAVIAEANMCRITSIVGEGRKHQTFRDGGVNGDGYALTGEENVGQKEVRFEMRHEDDDREEMILSQ